ncbi:MAG: hypothetical protein ACP5XB_25875 [Isosphaeraceae bacterium]
MKSLLASLAILGTLAATSARAQTGGAVPGGGASTPVIPGIPVGTPGRAFPNASSLPEPTPADELKMTTPLPNDPIEPWLLTKENGPFMVLAKTFRGVNSDRMALLLVKELHDKYGLPAYILRSKDWPGKSNIRGVPPTADPGVVQANIKVPERFRTYDEAAVLVGNEKTEKGAVVLLHRVKKIRPDCLQTLPKVFAWRNDLRTAIRTTNPYVPTQYLYPRHRDQLIVKMNQGARSLSHCPGRFSLQIAEFSGRATFNEKDPQFHGILNLQKSPLMTAADDAERLADKLANHPEFQKLHQPIYVYHNRTSSKVFVGSFVNDRDPAAERLHEALLRMAGPLVTYDKNDPKSKSRALDVMIVPAGMLTDLEPIKEDFRD